MILFFKPVHLKQPVTLLIQQLYVSFLHVVNQFSQYWLLHNEFFLIWFSSPPELDMKSAPGSFRGSDSKHCTGLFASSLSESHTFLWQWLHCVSDYLVGLDNEFLQVFFVSLSTLSLSMFISLSCLSVPIVTRLFLNRIFRLSLSKPQRVYLVVWLILHWIYR